MGVAWRAPLPWVCHVCVLASGVLYYLTNRFRPSWKVHGAVSLGGVSSVLSVGQISDVIGVGTFSYKCPSGSVGVCPSKAHVAFFTLLRSRFRFRLF